MPEVLTDLGINGDKKGAEESFYIYFHNNVNGLVRKEINIDIFLRRVIDSVAITLYCDISGKSFEDLTSFDTTLIVNMRVLLKSQARDEIISLYLTSLKKLDFGCMNVKAECSENGYKRRLCLSFMMVFHDLAEEHGVTDQLPLLVYNLMYNSFEEEDFESLNSIIAIAKRSFVYF